MIDNKTTLLETFMPIINSLRSLLSMRHTRFERPPHAAPSQPAADPPLNIAAKQLDRRRDTITALHVSNAILCLSLAGPQAAGKYLSKVSVDFTVAIRILIRAVWRSTDVE